eukprot:11151153-Karenia_brevis.AAC.1
MPDFDAVHREYVDNFVAFSRHGGGARKTAEEVRVELMRSGLPTHLVTAGQGLTTLGWSFESFAPLVGASPRSLWRIRLGIDELLCRGACTGNQLAAVFGHFTHKAMMRRELLSILNVSYKFVEKNRHLQ